MPYKGKGKTTVFPSTLTLASIPLSLVVVQVVPEIRPQQHTSTESNNIT